MNLGLQLLGLLDELTPSSLYKDFFMSCYHFGLKSTLYDISIAAPVLFQFSLYGISFCITSV